MDMRPPGPGTPLDPAAESDPLAKPGWAMSPREADRARRAAGGEPAPRRRWPWLVLLVVVVAAAGALAWQYRDALAAPAPVAEETESSGSPPLTQINATEWAVVEPRTLRRTVKVIGTLAPARRVDLSSEAEGRVEEVLARPGDRVEEGQILVQVDVERLSLELNLARSTADATRAQVALAEQQLDRSTQLVDRGVAAASTLDEARSNLEGLRANLAALDDQVAAADLGLGNATVRAPFAGVVSTRAVDPGAVVGAGAALLSVVDLSEVEMLAQAPIAAGASIGPGQAVEVTVDGVAGRTFAGEVARVAPVAEEGTRALTVYVRLANPDGTLLGGMFATGQIVIAEARDAAAVPTEALREDDDGAHVLVIEENALVRRAVVVGEEWQGGLTQVTEGLAPGDAVITVALSDLAAGTAVELVEF